MLRSIDVRIIACTAVLKSARLSIAQNASNHTTSWAASTIASVVGSAFEVGTIPVHLTVRVQPKTVQIRSIES